MVGGLKRMRETECSWFSYENHTLSHSHFLLEVVEDRVYGHERVNESRGKGLNLRIVLHP